MNTNFVTVYKVLKLIKIKKTENHLEKLGIFSFAEIKHISLREMGP